MDYKIGQKFNRLTVIDKSEMRHLYVVCRCDCGTVKEVKLAHVAYGATKSCGCLQSELSSARTKKLHESITKHGMSKTRVYGIWHAMRQRCENQNSTHYNRYGGRGITVCDRWRSFENFLSDMGEPAIEMTIERINNDLGYSPDNCKWATRKEQQNNRDICRHFTWRGETKTIAEWSQITGIHHNTITSRINSGLSPDAVMSPEKLLDLSGLELGSTKGAEARKARTHCRKGHEWTPENTGIQKTGRYCKRCDADRAKKPRVAPK